MGEWFGCCGKYVQCSDELKCTEHPEYSQYCYYKQNLEQGKIFYGKNKNIDNLQPKQIVEPEPIEINEVFMHCCNRLFAVFSFKGGFKGSKSYKLTQEQIQVIIDHFKTLEIPYSTLFVESECVVDKVTEDQCSANSRVIFKINDMEYSIYNFNSYLIKYKDADNIAKALNAKGVEARSEVVGGAFNNSYKTNTVPKVLPKEEPKEVPRTETEKPVYKQMSLFDFERVS